MLNNPKFQKDSKRKYKVLGLCAAAILLALIALVAGSKMSQPHKEQEKMSATDDLTLTIYTQHPTEFIIPLVKEFEERTGAQVTVIQGGSGELLARAQDPEEEQKPDILWGGSLYTMKPYAELFAEYQTINEDKVLSEFKNTEGNLIRFTDVPSVIMVNTDLLGDEEIHGYADLLDPAYKGKIAFANPNTSSSSWEQLINMLYAYGGDTQEAWDYVEALLTQLDGNILGSSSAVYNGVADGTYVIGLTFEEAAAGLRDAGKHVDIVYMEEGVVSTPDGVYLMKNAPNEALAKEFLDFVTGYDAQYMISRQLNRRSVRADITSPPSLASKTELHMLEVDAIEVAQKREQWLTRFNTIWEGLSE